MEHVLYEPAKWKSWLITFLCLSGISVSSFYLQKDITSFSFDRGVEWGSVVACGSDTKRRHSDSYLWTRLSPGQTVYRKDSVRVGPQGYASIQLRDGTKIELGENSFVIIDDSETLALKFVRGNFIVADGRGERAVSVQKDGRAMERKLAVHLLTPAPAARLYSPRGENVSVTLKWENKQDARAKFRDGARLMVSRDRLFLSAGTISQNVELKSSGEWSGSLAPGRYYWKVLAVNENLSEVRNFTILPVEPLVPIAPVSGESLLLFAGQRTVNFRWIPRDEGRGPSSELELSRELNFSDVAKTVSIDSRAGAASVEGLEAGKYFWRLRSQYGVAATVSRPSSFVLKTRDNLELALNEPGDGATYEVGRALRFSWDISEGNFDYVWEVDELTEPPKVEMVQTVRSGSLIWTMNRSGKFRWRVSAKFNGEIIGGSDWHALNVIEASPIELLSPREQEKISFWEGQWKIPFRWEEQSGDGKRYRVKIAEDAAFTRNLVSFVTVKAEFAWAPTASDGGYRFWKVEWLGKNDEIVRFSGPRRFFFGIADILPPPMAKFPSNGFEISLNDLSKEPELEWEKVDRALAYDIVVERDGKVWHQQRVEKGTKLKLRHLKAGSYGWSVRAVDTLKRKGELSSLHPFIVKPGDKLKAPTKTEWEIE